MKIRRKGRPKGSKALRRTRSEIGRNLTKEEALAERQEKLRIAELQKTHNHDQAEQGVVRLNPTKHERKLQLMQNRDTLDERLRNRGCKYADPAEAVARIRQDAAKEAAKDPLANHVPHHPHL